MICPKCEAENSFAAERCIACGNHFGPSRDNVVALASTEREVALPPVKRPTFFEIPADVLAQPQNLDWLGRYALWGMPLTYIVLVAASAFGLKSSMLVLKVLIGGGALWPLRTLLKKEPSNERALVARKFGRIQMAVMLAAELSTIPVMVVLPAQYWLSVGGLFLLAGFGVHVVVAVLGTRRLGRTAQRIG